MNNDHRLGFFAGLAGGIALGVVCARRRTPTLRKLVACKAKDTIKDTIDDVKNYATDLADSASGIVSKGKAGVVRRQDALVNAFDAGLRAYQKTAG